MEIKTLSAEGGKFASLDEELKFLREQVRQKEEALGGMKNESARDRLIRGEIHSFQQAPREAVLPSERQIPQSHEEAIVLDLAPKDTDEKISELLGIMQEKGILNALAIVEQVNDKEVEDDFHRFLVQYVKKGLPVSNGDQKSSLFSALHMSVFEVRIPQGGGEGDKERGLKELLSSMEQLYAGLIPPGGVSGEASWISLEIAVSNDRRDIVFYAAVPDSAKDLFEKQFLAVFPKGRLVEEKNDYNIFRHTSSTLCSVARFSKTHALPLKRAADFEYDPLNIVLNAFSKLAPKGEGAAVQIILKRTDFDYAGKYRKAIEKIEKGMPAKEALDIPDTFGGIVAKDIRGGLKSLFFGSKKKKEDEEKFVPGEGEKITIESLKKKIESEIILADIRLFSAAEIPTRAESILSELEGSFRQFADASGNSLVFRRTPDRRAFEAAKNFSFRIFLDDEALPLSLKELTPMFHFLSNGKDSPAADLKQVSSVSAPAPLEMASEGIVLGVNRHRGEERQIIFGKEDRLRHFYAIGQTGTGKTTLLKNMVLQDIARGEGVCMIDPHGSDIEDVLANIPKERYDDVIYFDPAYAARPMGLNMLEFDARFPEQKTFVVNELLSIFRKLFGAVPESMGPAFEQYFRNSAMLVMEDTASGNTLIEIGRVLSDKKFRTLKLSKCQNPIVKQFWENAEKTTGDQAIANYAQYVTNKFDTFTMNDIMRPVIAQEKSSFNFREIMDTKKILLVNLSKGRLGDINSHLIGLVLVGKILMAALSRADSLGTELPPFYLYIDEFQNVTTDSIATILSEARKYKLGLSVAHQFIKQLDEKISNAVFGNVGSIAVFRVGAEDSEILEKQFAPTFAARDLLRLENRHAAVKLLVDGSPARPFTLQTLAPAKGDPIKAEALKEISYLTYGKDREVVEQEIRNRFHTAE